MLKISVPTKQSDFSPLTTRAKLQSNTVSYSHCSCHLGTRNAFPQCFEDALNEPEHVHITDHYKDELEKVLAYEYISGV